MMAAAWTDCAGGCGVKVLAGGDRIACSSCYGRLPWAIRKEWRDCYVPGATTRSSPVMRHVMKQWWAANPPPRRPDDEVPLWRRHKQNGKD